MRGSTGQPRTPPASAAGDGDGNGKAPPSVRIPARAGSGAALADLRRQRGGRPRRGGAGHAARPRRGARQHDGRDDRQHPAEPRTARQGRGAAAGQGRARGRLAPGAGRRPALHAAQAARSRSRSRWSPGSSSTAWTPPRTWRCRRWCAAASTSGVQAKAFAWSSLMSLIGLAIVFGDWLVNIAEAMVVGRNGERLLYTLRVKIFAQLQRLGPRLLRARAVRPHHDQDDDRRGRAVHVPADRAGHDGQLAADVRRRARRDAGHQRAAGPVRAGDRAGADRGDGGLPA